ncbi:MAG: NAD(+)/NADH kinase [Endomicrobium sp.]|jgi:NAD+ kinase|nr:NAD(+)/NADH kinase [Endomicrobium sp.]
MKYKIAIIYNKSKSFARKISLDIAFFFRKQKCIVFVNSLLNIKKCPKVDFAISIGGDGTMLKVISYLAPLSIPIKGINLGSLGFLADTEVNNMFDLLRDILESGLKIEERTMLSIEFLYKNTTTKTISANDCIIRPLSVRKIIIVKIIIEEEYVKKYNCDGIIIATPTGSTASSLSASGPVIYPTLPVFVLTPILPHTLTYRSMVLSNKQNVTFVVNTKDNKGKIIISIDGQKNFIINNNTEIKFSLYKKNLKLIKNCCSSYFKTLNTKSSLF